MRGHTVHNPKERPAPRERKRLALPPAESTVTSVAGFSYGAIGASIHVFGDGVPVYVLLNWQPGSGHGGRMAALDAKPHAERAVRRRALYRAQ